MTVFQTHIISLVVMFGCARITVYGSRCSEPVTFPSIDFQEYVDIVWIGSNSGRPGFVTSLVNTTQYNAGTSGVVPDRRRHGVNLGYRMPGTSTINTISACPWTYAVSRARDRKPERLTHAVCLNSVTASGLLCEPLTRYISVYRRNGCVEGVWQYIRVWEPISTACIPINRPESSQSGNTRIVSPY